eukprot:COSAG03_NODE_6_length_26200_cov_62.015517_17_plen_72_part_00
MVKDAGQLVRKCCSLSLPPAPVSPSLPLSLSLALSLSLSLSLTLCVHMSLCLSQGNKTALDHMPRLRDELR